jgi:hypothetical protein
MGVLQMFTSWFHVRVVLKHRLVKAVSSVVNSVNIPMHNFSNILVTYQMSIHS